jgi:hypothetical protein
VFQFSGEHSVAGKSDHGRGVLLQIVRPWMAMMNAMMKMGTTTIIITSL